MDSAACVGCRKPKDCTAETRFVSRNNYGIPNACLLYNLLYFYAETPADQRIFFIKHKVRLFTLISEFPQVISRISTLADNHMSLDMSLSWVALFLRAARKDRLWNEDEGDALPLNLLYSVPVIWARMRKDLDCRLAERRLQSSLSSSGLFWVFSTAWYTGEALSTWGSFKGRVLQFRKGNVGSSSLVSVSHPAIPNVALKWSLLKKTHWSILCYGSFFLWKGLLSFKSAWKYLFMIAQPMQAHKLTLVRIMGGDKGE